MFAKSKRFDPLAPGKNEAVASKKPEVETPKPKCKIPPLPSGVALKETKVSCSKPKVSPKDTKVIETPKDIKDGFSKAVETPKDTKVGCSKVMVAPKDTKAGCSKAVETPKDTKVGCSKVMVAPKDTKVSSSKAVVAPKDTKVGCSKVVMAPKETKVSCSKAAETPKDMKVGCVKAKLKPVTTPVKPWDAQSQGSSVKSTKSFVTPRPVKTIPKLPTSLKKELISSKPPAFKLPKEDIFNTQEVEIRNKDYTLEEYNKKIEVLKNEIATLTNKLQDVQKSHEVESLNMKLSNINLYDVESTSVDTNLIIDLKEKISELENQCEQLEQEVSCKQVDLQSLEEIITIRDSLCKDLQEKLTTMETDLEETKQRLEMVKGHHALALEANESIRREYKAELEAMKSKFEDEKLIIITKSKADQDILKQKYISLIESIKAKLTKEKDEAVTELEQQLAKKEREMKARLEQIDETTEEKLRLCEIQFEERAQTIQEHWSQQEQQIKYLDNESKELKHSLNVTEELNMKLRTEINYLKKEIEILVSEKKNLVQETEELKEESKKKLIDFENEINKLTVEVERAGKEKHMFEMSLSVTRDIVQVLTVRLRESENELEHLENQVHSLKESKQMLEGELDTYKNSLNNTVIECGEYKDALVNILKSKAALAEEHNRIMEHNVTLIESLQNVEKEAYRELGTIKNEMIEDVEMLKKESKSQIQILRDEVEQKRMLCELATEHAGQATAAAEQSRALLEAAAAEIDRLEADNLRLKQQIEDQQSLVVELSLLRQENEELTMAVAKQSSIVDKMRKDAEHVQTLPKSPSLARKSHKAGKENVQVVVSPLRERNH